jgi:hypothetical protein
MLVGISFVVSEEHSLVSDPHHRPVLGEEAILLTEGFPAGPGALLGGQHPRSVLRVEPLFPQDSFRVEPLQHRISHQLLDLRTGVDSQVRIGADGPIRVGYRRDSLDKSTIPLLSFPEAALCLLALGNVSGGDHHALDRGDVYQVGAHALHPPPRAVLVEEAVLDLVGGDAPL